MSEISPKVREILIQNYSIYKKQQEGLINVLEKNLESEEDNSLKKQRCIKILESFYGRIIEGINRQLVGTASHHWHLLMNGQTYRFLEFPDDLKEEKSKYQLYKLKNDIVKELYPEHKEDFKNRDKKVGGILKSLGSPFYKDIDELEKEVNHLSNMIKSETL